MSTTVVNPESDQQPQEPEEPQQETGERYQSTTPYFTIIMLVAIIAVFLSELLIPIKLVRATAGLEKPFVTYGEWWRLLTASVIHDGPIHVAFNGYALYMLGRLMETLANRFTVPLVFVLAAVGGGILSYAMAPVGNSVGASGGILGLLGYLTVYGFKRRKILSNALFKNMLFNIALISFLGVVVIPNVDNFGHLGGLVAGLVFGLIQIPGDLYKDPRQSSSWLRYAGSASLVIILLSALVSIGIFLAWYLALR